MTDLSAHVTARASLAARTYVALFRISIHRLVVLTVPHQLEQEPQRVPAVSEARSHDARPTLGQCRQLCAVPLCFLPSHPPYAMSKTLEDDLFFDSDLSSLSDDSENDELEQDEEPPEQSTASTSKAPAKRASGARKPAASKSTQHKSKGYVVQDTLRPPRNTQLSVRSLHGACACNVSCFPSNERTLTEQIVNGSVDLDPDYQRGTSGSDFWSCAILKILKTLCGPRPSRYIAYRPSTAPMKTKPLCH